MAEPGSGTGPYVIFAADAAASASPWPVPTVICAPFPATPGRTGDRAARSIGASREQAPSEVARGAVAHHARAGHIAPRHCTASRQLSGMRAAILAVRMIIASSRTRPALTTERANQ